MISLTLKNVPAELHARLKASAEDNRRSLNREILARLEAQMAAPAVDVDAEQRSLEQFVRSLPRSIIDASPVTGVQAAHDRR